MDGPQGNPKSGTPRPYPIPDHQLIKCVGRGSYGHVWLARNVMGVYRAVKIVERSSFKSDRPYLRELEGIRQYEPVSRSHPGLAAVLHVGKNEKEKYFYYVMEAADDVEFGQAIDPEKYQVKTLSWLAQSQDRPSFDECVKIGLSLSDALRHLHENDLIHRDIKPANILFINGYPKVADIGLVTDLGGANTFVGTEGFIPPEGPNSYQADVYSFGKTLYELSTGLDRDEFPSLPEHWHQNPESDRYLELNAVLTKSCHFDLAVRYSSFKALHSDLSVLASGSSIRRLHSLEAQLLRIKKHLRLAATIAVIVIMAAIIVLREQRFQIEQEAQNNARKLARGIQLVDDGDYIGALPDLMAFLKHSERRGNRDMDHRLRIGSVLMQSPKLALARSHASAGSVSYNRLTPDNAHLMIGYNNGLVEAVSLRSNTVVSAWHPHEEGSHVYHLDCSPDNQWGVSGGSDRTARIWRLLEGQNHGTLEHPAAVNSSVFSKDGRYILTACDDGKARLWNWRKDSGAPERTFDFGKRLTFATFNPVRGQIFVLEDEVKFWIVDLESGDQTVLPVEGIGDWQYHCAVSPDGNLLGTGGGDYSAHIWDIETKRVALPPMKHDWRAVSFIDFSPDGQYILTAGFDRTVRLWDALAGEPISPILPHSAMLACASFGVNGRLIATGCVDGTSRVWDLAGGYQAKRVKSNYLSANGNTFLLESNAVLHAGFMASPQSHAPISMQPGGLGQEILDESGEIIASQFYDSESGGLLAQVRSIQESNRLGRAFPLPEGSGLFGLSPRGEFLLSTQDVKRAACHDARSGELLWQHDYPVALKGCRFSSDGGLAVLYGGTNAWLHQTEDGMKLIPVLRHTNEVHSIAIDPLNRYLVACSSDTTLIRRDAYVWRIKDGSLAARLRHEDGVLAADFSPDGRYLVTGSEDATAIIWDAKNEFKPLNVLRQRHRVNDVRFVNEGHWILTAGGHQHARLWEAESGLPLSPMIEFPFQPVRGWMLPESRRIVVDMINTDIDSYMDLTPVEEDLETLEKLVYLLSSNNPLEPFAVSHEVKLSEAWKELESNHPRFFNVTQEEIMNWHDYQGLRGYTLHNWAAEAFHMRVLERLKPGDADVLRRLSRAEANMAALTARQGRL